MHNICLVNRKTVSQTEGCPLQFQKLELFSLIMPFRLLDHCPANNFDALIFLKFYDIIQTLA